MIQVAMSNEVVVMDKSGDEHGVFQIGLALQDMRELQLQLDTMVLARAEKEYFEVLEDIKKALFIEVGEFINEGKSFKYWSTKSADITKLGLELADCQHFAMSLLAHMVEPNQEIMIDIERALYLSTVNTVGELENMLIINATTILTSHLDRDMLINMLIYNMTLQYAIAFKYDILPRDIYQYYLWKNQINIQRQKENY